MVTDSILSCGFQLILRTKIKFSKNSSVVIHCEPTGNGVTVITIQLYGANLQDRVNDRKPNRILTD